MIPQTPRHKNDCMAVCLSSVLEIPIEQVPDFFTDYKGAANWYGAISRWLKKHGWHLFYTDCAPLQFAEFQTESTAPDEAWPPSGYWFARIARVEWIVNNDVYHVVVMKDHKLILNPDGPKKVKDNDIFILGYYLLVPLDPKFHKEG
jgi:hypothetical protein